MKAYGMKAGDFPRCCPGHDTYSLECYNSNRSKRAHTKATKILHRRGRRTDKLELAKEVSDGNEEV
ncbi:hypothetical protein EVB55_098 [Rhizobium phage RHph_Y68]|uniref:Uncharacterized protein n=1 Tax=Rhizobium phage RHph_Y68 TaxID=2509787 RepID=A0A7S5UUE4_9CAUD|nr:hypothetical protein PP934_gp098 [Rhizobium phage RHph_Y68]QIG68033.1 hypothetical protein EVB55_098 [Rhizobium phage RHph_Y68]